MSMEDFAKTLTPEQRKALFDALSKTESVTLEEHEEKTSTNNVADDFTMIKENNLQSNSRRVPVKAQQNGWTDTGEHKNIETPQITKTPRNRKPASKMSAKCHVCGKSISVDKRFQYGEFIRCDNCCKKR